MRAALGLGVSFAFMIALLGCVGARASAPDVLPGPIRIPSSPYYYGVLAHPWTIGPKTRRIGNQNVPDESQNQYVERLLDSWQRMGVRYVRMDYAGFLIEDRQGRVNFSNEDDIADRLARHGMIELPVCLQYGAARWNNPGQNCGARRKTTQHFAGPSPSISKNGTLSSHASN